MPALRRHLMVALVMIGFAVRAGAQVAPPQGGVIGGIVTGQSGPPRDARAVPTGTGRISGVVTAADSARPLRRATVRLSAIGGAAPPPFGLRTGSTDADGRYEFTDLPAGRYTVSASRTGYVQMSFGQKRPLATGQTVTVQDGTTTVRVDIALPVAGVITGRVVDEYGEPIADMSVMAMRSQFMSGGRRLVPSGAQATTNDIGEFRLHSLAPGDYLVSVMNRGVMMGTTDRAGYSTTFYPSAASPDLAQTVAVHAAETISNIVVMLAPSRLNKVTGYVVGTDGQPVENGSVMVMPRNGLAFANSGGMIRPDGTFEIAGVADGEYNLRAMIGGPMMGPGPQGPPLQAAATITVAGNDLANVILRPPRQMTISGRVTGDPAALAAIRPGTMQVVAARMSPNDIVGPTSGPAPLLDDFTFALTVYPGRLSVRGMGLNGLLIDSVRWHGSDVTRGFDLGEGDDGSGFEVTLTNQTARLAVTTVNASGEPAGGYDVLIFAADSSWWGAIMPGHFSTGRTNETGRFETPPLVPGAYYVIALDGMETFRSGDPEFLESVRSRAQRVSLANGDTATVQTRPVEP